jgi:hypothetical protein
MFLEASGMLILRILEFGCARRLQKNFIVAKCQFWWYQFRCATWFPDQASLLEKTKTTTATAVLKTCAQNNCFPTHLTPTMFGATGSG